MEENIIRPNKGLHTDNSPQDQPKDTYRFALNSVNETELGDFAFLGNEEGNEPCDALPNNFIPIGKVYIGEGQTVIFSVSKDGTISEIGILNNGCVYTTHVNDEFSDSTDKLNFKITHQIQATYRLRRGCERTIYWTDDFNKPRYYNFDKPEDFKNGGGTWGSRFFSLFKDYNKIPEFTKIDVLDSGGQLKSGSYNVAIQYLDNGLNGTEWITVSPTINIYNSSVEGVYRDIRGSLPPNGEISYLDFPETSKAIYVEFDANSLDTSFLFYRLAFIEATSGSGMVTQVKFSDVISTTKNYFIYTGTNAVEQGVVEELVFASEKIERAQSIEQIENRLLLANTEGKNIDFCKLQKYASKIKADCITKTVDLTRVHPIVATNIDSNPKNPSANFEGFGYMPGEIYSFGIVYVFEDGSTTPVYHIPGKSNAVDPSTVFQAGEDVYPMSINNTSQSTYKDNETCGNTTIGYWGLDSEGDVLTNSPVRHHRFPIRKDIGLDLVRTIGVDNTSTIETVSLQINLDLDILLPFDADPDATPTPIVELIKNPFHIKVLYTVNGSTTGEIVMNVDPNMFKTNEDENVIVSLFGTSPPYEEGSTFQIDDIIIIVPQEIIDAELLLATPQLVQDQYLNLNYYISTYNDFSVVNSAPFYFNPLNQPTAPVVPINVFPTGLGTSFTNSQSGSPEDGIKVDTYIQTLDSKQFESDLLGIKFSGVELPSLEDTNGNKIVGYYIVRNERTDFEKTIVDSAVLVPTLRNNKYISHGLLSPDFSLGNATHEKTTWGVIHPEHKFRDNKIFDFDEIIQEGNFAKDKILYGKITQNDIAEGTSFDSGAHKDGNDDGSDGYGNSVKSGVTDGFSIDIISRDFITDYKTINNGFNITKSQVEKQFYLDALSSETLEYPVGQEYLGKRFWDVYNIAADNKIGILKLKNSEVVLHNNVGQYNLPYVIYRRSLLDNYSTFRQSTYFKTHTNVKLFDEDNPVDTIETFGGDSMIHPMRYVNTIFWDTRVAKRAGRTNAWNVILAATLFVAAAVIAVFSFGSGVAASTALIGAGAALVAAGGGALFAAAAVKEAAYRRAYSEEYAKGLRETALDKWVRYFYQYPNYNTNLDNSFGIPVFTSEWNDGVDGPSDDTVQWIGDCITDLWFETSVNISLRNGFSSNLSTHLNAPGFIESGNVTQMHCREYFRKKGGARWVMSYTRNPVSKLEQHLHKKLLMSNPDKYEGYEYTGLPTGEYYNVNPDYNRTEKEKIFYHLPLEYDCCSDCQENFPHRWHWSEQSFQEELTDNYRTFLPNNYKDLEGETGEITNIFKIGNDLFIHTREALWQVPRNYQERVTDQIISFIGTGSYGEIPAQKIIDDDTGSSAGSQHKWSLIKTPMGVFFISENQRKVYQFDGRALKAISSFGLENWFKNNMQLLTNKQYYEATGKIYPYNDNPSNPFGTGFISTYDTRKERVIFTKKDFELQDVIETQDFEICVDNGQLTYFPDFNQIIADREADGWTFVGIVDCKLRFERTTISTKTEIRTITINLPNTADVVVWLDTSGSFTVNARNQIKSAINSWLTDFASENPDWTGNLHYLEYPSSPSEEWINSLQAAKTTLFGGSLAGRDILMLTFVNEAQPAYHSDWSGATIASPTGQYTSDASNFMSIVGECNSFAGLAYPIVFPNNGTTKEYLKHVLAAVKGISYTSGEANQLEVNPFFTSGEWTTLKTAITGTNPYLNDGLENYGWSVITNRGWSGSGEVLTAQQFQEDMTSFLEGQTTAEEIEVEVSYADTEYESVDGVILENPIKNNNSWTISHSLKLNTWTSWHSYLPEFYINTPEKFYSWRYGSDIIWKHNRRNVYQTYYGEFHPHIIEYISLSNPLITRFWNHIRLNTEARTFDEETQQYFEERFITHNKLVVFNSRQCSGLLNLLVKDTQPNPEDYFSQQIVNRNNNTIVIDRTERDWFINDLRDIRIDYTKPIWNANLDSLQSEYFIDKILNTITMDPEKDWTQLESFKDKYLVIRLIFDNFATIKLITNYSVENEQQSFI